MNYQSSKEIVSSVSPGVRYVIARISFGRRLELTRRVRELGRRIEFQQAGNSLEEKLDAAIATAEIDQLYIDWGLLGIQGLEIDGSAAEKSLLIDLGPEDLCKEIVAEIRNECGLTDDQVKN